MITIGPYSFRWDDPLTLAIAGAAALLLLFLVLILRASGRSAAMAQPLMQQVGNLSYRVQALSDGQERLSGGLHHVSEAQAVSQSAMLCMYLPFRAVTSGW